jgi:type VI secretion system protein ImpH
MKALDRLRRRANLTALPQAARLIELVARRTSGGRRDAEIGADTPPAEEPLRFVASDRMALPANDVAEIEAGEGGPVRVTTNVLGLAGATPALPPFYSEIQLQRRRLRDRSFASFLNVFDHRTLSFFYRVFRKYNWVIAFERESRAGDDPITGALLAIGGLGTPATRGRLSFDDGVLVPLAARLGDMRRSAAGLETALRHVTGLPLRVAQAEPTWMPLPLSEQSRLGAPGGFGGLARLGGEDAAGFGYADAAVIGAAVLDVQHHFAVEIGPLGYSQLLDFCHEGSAIRMVGDVCRLAAGIEHRPVVRLAVAAGEIPPLRLAAPETPAYLGRTTWLGDLGAPERIVTDCTIPVAAMPTGTGDWD